MAKNLIDNPPAPLPSGNPTETALLRLLVSHQVMGSIIGKGGARIKEIQEESGARIGVRKEMLPQSTERIVDISGLIDSIQIAVFYIGECIFDDADRAVGTILYNPAPPPPHPHHRGAFHGEGRGRGRPRFDDGYDDGAGHAHYNNNYYNNSSRPYNSTRRPLGNHNSYNSDPNSTLSNRPTRGGYHSNSRSVGGMVGSRAGHPNGTSMGKSSSNNPGQSLATGSASEEGGAEVVQKTTSIPADMVGCIIGLGGSVINDIRMQSGAKISISKETDRATNERTFTLEGTQDALDKALSLLYKQLENEKARRLANANGSSRGGNTSNSGTAASTTAGSSNANTGSSEVVAAS